MVEEAEEVAERGGAGERLAGEDGSEDEAEDCDVRERSAAAADGGCEPLAEA